MVLTLYKVDMSPPVRAVYMTIEALKIPDVKHINVKLFEKEHYKDDYLKMNPQHTVPTLKDDDFVVWDSHAIAGYLVAKYADNDSLYPRDPKKRALIDQRLHFDSGILFATFRWSLEPVFYQGENRLRPENVEKIKKAYEFTESFLTSPWLVGEEATLADICCVATISTLNEVLAIDGDKNITMVLTLYKIDMSPPVRAVFMTIEALNIPDVEYITLNMREKEHFKDDYLKMNPQHTVPLLKDDDFVVWDSHAIAGYLVAKYADNDSLYPRDPKKRALIDQRLHFDSGILFASLRGTVEPVFYQGENKLRPENVEKIKRAYEFTETFLAISPWMVGEELTLADICCVATVSSMNELVPIDGEKYPNIIAWWERIAKEDFYKKGNVSGLLQLREIMKIKLK